MIYLKKQRERLLKLIGACLTIACFLEAPPVCAGLSSGVSGNDVAVTYVPPGDTNQTVREDVPNYEQDADITMTFVNPSGYNYTNGPSGSWSKSGLQFTLQYISTNPFVAFAGNWDGDFVKTGGSGSGGSTHFDVGAKGQSAGLEIHKDGAHNTSPPYFVSINEDITLDACKVGAKASSSGSYDTVSSDWTVNGKACGSKKSLTIPDDLDSSLKPLSKGIYNIAVNYDPSEITDTLNDSGKLRVLEVLVEPECAHSTTSGLLASWPHDPFWNNGKSYGPDDVIDEIVGYSAKVTFKPVSISAKPYSIKYYKADGSGPHSLVSGTLPGGVHTFNFPPEAKKLEVSWGPCKTKWKVPPHKETFPYQGSFGVSLKHEKLMKNVDFWLDPVINKALQNIRGKIKPKWLPPGVGMPKFKSSVNKIAAGAARNHYVEVPPKTGCCAKTEHDYKRVSADLSVSFSCGVEDDLKSVVADLIYNSLPPYITKVISAIGTVSGVNVEDWIKNKLAAEVPVELSNVLKSKLSLDLDNAFEHKFDTAEKITPSLQSYWKQHGKTKAKASLIDHLSINSTKKWLTGLGPIGKSVYNAVKKKYGKDWGWQSITAVPVYSKVSYYWKGSAMGSYVNSSGYFYQDCKRLSTITGRFGFLFRINWDKAHYGGQKVTKALYITGWDPIQVKPGKKWNPPPPIVINKNVQSHPYYIEHTSYTPCSSP